MRTLPMDALRVYPYRFRVATSYRIPTLTSRREFFRLPYPVTTGATLDEIAATLKRAGATRVVNWVVARTAPHV